MRCSTLVVRTRTLYKRRLQLTYFFLLLRPFYPIFLRQSVAAMESTFPLAYVSGVLKFVHSTAISLSAVE